MEAILHAKTLNSDSDKNTTILNGKELYQLFTHGITNVINYKKTLDEINVFPVPDGDTGTNIVFTLLPILNQDAHITEDASEIYHFLASTALDSARGNSGTILAQFFDGMRQEHATKQTVSISDFVKSFIKGFELAQSAIEQPVEGTIITVMHEVAKEAASLLSDGCDNYYSCINRLYKRAEESLMSTKLQLDVLKKSDVVDAGAYGFVLFLQGMLNYFSGTAVELKIDYNKYLIDSMNTNINLKFKYCTECNILTDISKKDAIKKAIESFGDSLVIGGNQNKIKIHIHTNSPEKLFEICSQFGKIVDKKADDMSKQEYSAHANHENSIAIVTDTGADVPEDYLNDLHIVNLRYSFGENQHIDKLTQTTREFYEEMRTNTHAPKTSQPPVSDFKKAYSFASSHYKSIISIHLSKKVSGTYQSALSAAQNLKDTNISVIDSASASVGQGLLAMHAVDLKRAGKSYDEILDELQKVVSKIQIYFVIDDLSYLVKGGRLSSKVKTTFDYLRVRPVLTSKNGVIRPAGIVFGKSDMVKKFSNYVQRKIDKRKKYKLIVAHADCEKFGQEVVDTIVTRHKNSITANHLLSISGALGSHAGPGALAVGLQEIS